jgi:hypothetical protein
MSLWPLRKRVPSEQVSGGNIRIAHGVFGAGSPAYGRMGLNPNAGLYHYHEGDLFNPGTGNYVFEYPFELPLQTIWGMAFLRRPNTFNPIQPIQSFAPPNVVPNGIGGTVAGQIIFQPLIPNEQGGA